MKKIRFSFFTDQVVSEDTLVIAEQLRELRIMFRKKVYFEVLQREEHDVENVTNEKLLEEFEMENALNFLVIKSWIEDDKFKISSEYISN